jgi:putative hydrolase of the HAD superfamily
MSKLLRDVRFVLFDAVGTLIYPLPSVSEVYATYGQKYGSRLTSADIHPRFLAAFAKTTPGAATSEAHERERWRQIVREVLEDVVEQHDALFAELWQHFGTSSNWQLFDDVAPVWQELCRRGLAIGIASNFDARLRCVCAGHAPMKTCERWFVSSEVGYAKPDPRYFAAIAAQLSAAPEEILLIGDDPMRDFKAASAAGWRALLIDRAATSATADCIHDLRQLLL